MRVSEAMQDVDERVEPGDVTGEGHDSIRRYFAEIGRVRLLTAQQEAVIGRRIEEGRQAVWHALAAMPSAVRELRAAIDGLRRGEVPPEEIVVLPTGADPDRATLRAVIRAVTRLPRRGPARAAALAALPLNPALLDTIVSRLRAAGEPLAEVERAVELVAAAKRDLIEANLRLVVSVAKRYRWSGLPFGDLIQDGNLGLMRAVDKFQYRRGLKFSTYATWWIRQAITRGIADRGRTIRLPVHVSEKLNGLMRSRATLVDRLGREPSTAELARHARIPAPKVQLLLDAAPRPVSLELPVGDDATLADFLEDRSVTSPAERLADAERAAALARAVDRLEPREREIVRLRFGLGPESPQTLEEVGRRLHLTRERIRQLESKALARLRELALSPVATLSARPARAPMTG